MTEVEILIKRMTSPANLDRTSLRVYEGVVAPVYQGGAYIHTVSGSGDTYIGDAGIPLRTTTISLPAEPVFFGDLQPRVDDVISILACVYDLSLVGRAFQVVGLGGGGAIRTSRELLCTSWGDSNNWEQR